MDPIKDAFDKVKSDFYYIQNEINDLKSEFSEIQLSLLNITKMINRELTNSIIKQDRQTDTSTHKQTNSQTNKHTNNQLSNPLDPSQDNSTKITMKVLDILKEEIIQLREQINMINLTSTQNNQNTTQTPQNTTEYDTSTDTSTHNYPFQALKQQKTLFSMRNEGVSTDRQTDQQTDNTPQNQPQIPQKTKIDTSKILNQLDGIKKELRVKIKQLTKQEMMVYSAIYQFEDQGHDVDYNILSTNLGLSESSIRDYIQRIILKGLPLIKEKENNKRVILKIPFELRKLATLDTILKLRDL